MNLDEEIARLKSLKLAFIDGTKARDFAGVRFECYGFTFSCEIWFFEIRGEADAPTMVEAFAAAHKDLMSKARVVSEEECRKMDEERKARREAMYQRWADRHPGEKFNLILSD